LTQVCRLGEDIEAEVRKDIKKEEEWEGKRGEITSREMESLLIKPSFE
jgi:hypothetical protein